MRKIMGAICLLAGAVSGPAMADQTVSGFTVSELIDERFIETCREWLEVPVLRMTVENQNLRRGEVSPERIEELDQAWRKERESDHQPFVAAVLSNPLSTYLTRIQARSLGLYSEIIVVDDVGLNAGQSSVTGDYWQGDEDKFTRTFGEGAGAVFIDQPELNEETATWRAQLNMTLHDAAGAPLGAATVEVNLTELARRRLTVGH